MSYEDRVQRVAEAIHGLPDSEAAQCMARAAIAASDATLEVTPGAMVAARKKLARWYPDDSTERVHDWALREAIEAALAAMRGEK